MRVSAFIITVATADNNYQIGLKDAADVHSGHERNAISSCIRTYQYIYLPCELCLKNARPTDYGITRSG